MVPSVNPKFTLKATIAFAQKHHPDRHFDRLGDAVQGEARINDAVFVIHLRDPARSKPDLWVASYIQEILAAQMIVPHLDTSIEARGISDVWSFRSSRAQAGIPDPGDCA